MHYVGYRALLDAQGARLYDELRAGFSARKTQFTVGKVNKSLFSQVLGMVELDLPEVYEIGTVTHYTSSASQVMRVEPNYHPCGGDAERAALETQRRKIIKLIPEGSDWDKMLKLHDILCRNIVYRDIGPDAHSIKGPLLRREAVCEGIAKTVKYICDALHIPCSVIEGKARSSPDDHEGGPHAWNKVMLDGQWVNVDVTFDLGTSKQKFIRHDYFAIPDEVILRDHSEARQTRPCVARNIDYFTRKGLVMKNPRALLEELKRRFRLSGDQSFEFRLPYEIKGIEVSTIIKTLEKGREACNWYKTAYIGSNPGMCTFSLILG